MAGADLAATSVRVAASVDRLFGHYLGDTGDGRDRLFAAMRHAGIGGGKRLRPLLTVATARLFGLDEERAIRAGAAIEAIHVYSLIHDDLPCMDDDDLRRGKPTVHRLFDEATAVLAGDCFHDLAYEILGDVATHEDPFVRAELVLALSRATACTRLLSTCSRIRRRPRTRSCAVSWYSSLLALRGRAGWQAVR